MMRGWSSLRGRLARTTQAQQGHVPGGHIPPSAPRKSGAATSNQHVVEVSEGNAVKGRPKHFNAGSKGVEPHRRCSQT